MICREWGGLGHRFRPYDGPGTDPYCRCGARPGRTDPLPAFAGFAEPEARARSTDRETSRAAARSVRRIRETQRTVLEVLGRIGPATDEELVDAFERLPGVWIPSGIRTRRNELVELGLVEEVGFGTTRTGRRATLWAVSPRANGEENGR